VSVRPPYRNGTGRLASRGALRGRLGGWGRADNDAGFADGRRHAVAIRSAIRAGDADALEQACADVAELVEVAGAALIQAGAHVAIVEATREASRAGHSNALWQACRALQNLASSTGGADASTPLVQADAHVAFVEAIRGTIRAGRPDVMEGACEVHHGRPW
jgi:hypothetical protein